MKQFYERYWDVHDEELEDFKYKLKALYFLFPHNLKGVILDYGCGKGKMLTQLRLLNPKAKIIGVDVSKTALKNAKRMNPSGSFVHITESKKTPLKSHSIDYIVCFDVIEHIYDTEFVFKEFSRLLKKRGTLFITTPYFGFFKNIFLSFYGFDIVYDPKGPHIRFYTIKTLKSCIEGVGLSLSKFGFFGRFFPVWRGMYMIAEKI